MWAKAGGEGGIEGAGEGGQEQIVRFLEVRE